MPLFFAAGPDLGTHREGLEILGAQQVRRDVGAVEGGVRGVVADASVLVAEPHQRASSMPWLSRRWSGRSRVPTGRSRAGRSARSRSQPYGGCAREARRCLHPGAVELDRREHVLELLRGELLRQPAEHALRRDGVTVLVEGTQNWVDMEVWVYPTVVSMVGASSSRTTSFAARVPGAELQTGNMPLTDGPGGHHESQLTGREAALVRVRRDGGIEQCRGLDGVLMRQVSADDFGPEEIAEDAGIRCATSW